jgi:NADH:ubiquinone reductase (H+-translocating)
MNRTIKQTRIVIAGGGFAGLYAARYLDKRLARRSDVEVTLVSRENFILFTPMLHEVAAGDLSPSDIVNPLRRILRHVNVVEAEIEAIDPDARTIRCLAGVRDVEIELQYDHLLLALGSETNFFNMHDVHDWAVTMKNLMDAALLRNQMVRVLEEASLRTDEASRRELLTFVVAGGGFAGVETVGAINDFVRETAKFYPSLGEEKIRVVVVHPGQFLLPELGEGLGTYAERKLRARNVEVIKGAHVSGYDGSLVRLTDGTSIAASTLVWTAGVKANRVLESLPYLKERGRLLVTEYLGLPELNGVWAAGDCAAVPNVKPNSDSSESSSAQTASPARTFYPPTAQHGLREAIAAAKNIEAMVLDRPLKPFRYRTIGLLASIGHHTGVAKVLGIKFSGFLAWWMWRTVYLAKLPGLAKKVRVMVDWTLDLLFGREIEQMITLRDAEMIADRLAKAYARTTREHSLTATHFGISTVS